MKINILTLLIIFSFINIGVFAQFGGGSGTEQDPYRLYTSADIYELADSLDLSNTFTGRYFRLMNNIEEPINRLGVQFFDGSFNGGGHSINIDLEGPIHCVFSGIGINGILDSLKIIGNTDYFLSLVCGNSGIIRNCTCDITVMNPYLTSCLYPICNINAETGLVESCVNLTNFINEDIEQEELALICGAGICYMNYGTIRKCINKGNTRIRHGDFAGLVRENWGLVESCINVGNIIVTDSTIYPYQFSGGIVGSAFPYSIVRNCINTGNMVIFSTTVSGGIVGDMFYNAHYSFVENCLNLGEIYGYVDESYEASGGGIVGLYSSGLLVDSIEYGVCNNVKNCLNISNNGGGNIIADTSIISALCLSNNYYDKQMGINKGLISEDHIGIAEGKLTTQLIGTSPELQAMLGDGWSYAEGRYPIPLGLENDSMALLAATPIYLPYEDQDNYNTVDSVTCHFTLGTENNVEWTSNPSQIELIQSENELKGVLQTTGFANLSAYLDGFTKNILLNIKSICQPDYKKEEIQKTQITAYPNPTKDILYFNQASAYEIYDLQGKLVMKSNKPQNFVNTAELKPGMYIIKIGEEVIKFEVE
ncbi:MAG: T9SS type A sorting domain-containing protein [Bacteroidales bacterium]|jgi:hypothetical protein|nr:T9SS type A sorting domain-containing protein [Bacteroidales bacterium]MCK9498798.1 T9SS type A sorting domain-containing protein [Bacteroidales bacterium]MDY0313859.1 T9SS type A sorting domain-containing protein [Bacteroidales bacterium]NLB87438.1 T9SS type A sorting domain-containing protein [Bacteroidales bacterium]